MPPDDLETLASQAADQLASTGAAPAEVWEVVTTSRQVVTRKGFIIKRTVTATVSVTGPRLVCSGWRLWSQCMQRVESWDANSTGGYGWDSCTEIWLAPDGSFLFVEASRNMWRSQVGGVPDQLKARPATADDLALVDGGWDPRGPDPLSTGARPGWYESRVSSRTDFKAAAPGDRLKEAIHQLLRNSVES